MEPLGAVQMGLIYVNPEGPNGNPDPLASATDIRETFARMAMNDEETVALVAGGHTFGKAHGAGDPDLVGPEPEGAPMEQMGLGWKNAFGTGKGVDTTTSGIEGAWTATPITWDSSYFDTLFGYEWELTRAPPAPSSGRAVDPEAQGTVPDAHDPTRTHAPMMTTADMALRMDPVYEPISRRFRREPGAVRRRLRPGLVQAVPPRHGPRGPLPRPRGPHRGADLAGPGADRRPRPDRRRRHRHAEGHDPRLRAHDLGAGHAPRGRRPRRSATATSVVAPTEPVSASPPQNGWEVNDPDQLRRVLATLEGIKASFDASGSTVSMADLIVLGGAAAIEAAARDAGHDVTVPFTPGRTDASQEQTDVDSFAVLEPTADGFRNHLGKGHPRRAEALLVDRAQLLTLSAPEMTVLLGGLRVLGANSGGSTHGVFTERVGALTTDFFVNLLDLSTEWHATDDSEELFEGRDRVSGELRWTGTRNDLVFGANSQLRAIAEVYGAHDAAAKFVADFVAAWTKVMDADRFDV